MAASSGAASTVSVIVVAVYTSLAVWGVVMFLNGRHAHVRLVHSNVGHRAPEAPDR
jgi:hypothetical protein